MPKNIIVYCDGTGNEIEEDLSNVLKLYQISTRDEEQVVFYDSGVGTIGKSNTWTKLRDKVGEIATGATGYGIDENVLDAYRFLAEQYVKGDKIFIFGFSRGAYTARVLAGFIRALGLLHPAQLNLLPYAQKWYKHVSDTGDFSSVWRFSEVTNSRMVRIHFLGVWDTVSSVFRPNGKLLSVGLTNKLYPYTVNNDAVKIVRHAVAIDEKRKTFKADLWGDKKLYKSNPFDPSPEPQDVKEVWFAGVHSDIGGGYPESESALAKIPLKWMVSEAVKAGLKISKSRYKRLVLGEPRTGSKRVYVAPNKLGKAHESFESFWRLMGKHMRAIPDGALVHESVRDRLLNASPAYAANNLDTSKCVWEPDVDCDLANASR
ncbi:MAG: DUF2235 domain-containing protein [Alphaproteobacteria bacterium]|nr:MAG: DUF2235 domain-containing protein [Alphaproteobacteria bacterium]